MYVENFVNGPLSYLQFSFQVQDNFSLNSIKKGLFKKPLSLAQ